VHLTRLALTDFRSYTDVDVPLKPGVTIFSGPNGEGKTMLLQVVSGLMPPTEGFAEVIGEPVNGADLADLRSRVGISSAAVAEQVPGLPVSPPVEKPAPSPPPPPLAP